MDNEVKDPTDQPTESTTEVEKPNNSEALDRKNRELLGKLKAEKQKRQEFEDRLAAIEQEKLESEGKYVDAYKKTKEQLELAEKRNKEVINGFRFRAIESAITNKALEAGCKKPNAILRLLDNDDKSLIEVDDSYNVDSTTLSPIMDKMREEYPELFQKTSPAVKDVPPTRDIAPPNEKELTEEEILEGYVKDLDSRK